MPAQKRRQMEIRSRCAKAALAGRPQRRLFPRARLPEEIAKMEDEADRLNIRAATASHSVDTLLATAASGGI